MHYAKLKLFVFVTYALMFAFTGISSAADGTCGSDCTEPPTCLSLGYKPKANIICEEGFIVCPFDAGYIWCKQYSCLDGRYENENNSSNSCLEVSYHGLTCYDCSCADYPLTQMSDYGIYETCQSGSVKKYKLVGCIDGYTYLSTASGYICAIGS